MEFKLADLFVKYYFYVKKRKNIDCDLEHFNNTEDLDDIQHTILLLLNHLACDEENKNLTENEVEQNIKELLGGDERLKNCDYTLEEIKISS